MDAKLHAVVTFHHLFYFFVIFWGVMDELAEYKQIVIIVFGQIRYFKGLGRRIYLKTAINFTVKMTNCINYPLTSPQNKPTF